MRLLIVPGDNVFDAVVETALRLQSAEIYVGESETLSADEQARLLGEAWERAAEAGAARRPPRHPPSQRRHDAYHLGAHAPALDADDLDLIHRSGSTSASTVGPHVHHRDVVRAALKHMEEQLNGPDRDAALAARPRHGAGPPTSWPPSCAQRDFARLRDMVRNRPASDLADDAHRPRRSRIRSLVFRVLPRKDAAATFEYLSLDAQEALLKAMAQEDVAALLNDMAPDDRTTFLEELPAERHAPAARRC